MLVPSKPYPENIWDVCKECRDEDPTPCWWPYCACDGKPPGHFVQRMDLFETMVSWGLILLFLLGIGIGGALVILKTVSLL